MHKVAVLVGSLRAASINLSFARALEKLATGKLEFVYPDLSALPIYNDDLWANPPAGALALKQTVEAADAVLFVTPEFNRTIPAALSNAIFWGSRPWGKNSWAGKPASVVGTSPGGIGSAVAQSHLRSVVTVLDTVLMGQPEVYFQTKPGLIDEDFNITDPDTKAFLEGYIARFQDWIARHASDRSASVAAE